MGFRVVVAGDSAGVDYKDVIKADLEADPRIDEVIDAGITKGEDVDYPHVAVKAARMIADGKADRGVFICGTGMGVAMSANKVKGIRAALANNVELARLAREHNDANVIALGGRMQSLEAGYEIVATFLSTEFSGEERHQRRIEQLAEYEAGR